MTIFIIDVHLLVRCSVGLEGRGNKTYFIRFADTYFINAIFSFILQVQVSENRWMRVGHLPGAILFHAGQHLQNWTSGKYKFLVSVKLLLCQIMLNMRLV